MQPIIKAFGQYIDLDKLVSITDAYFINKMGSGGYFVGFSMYFQSVEKPIPIEYVRRFEHDESIFEPGEQPRVVTVSGVSRKDWDYYDGSNVEDILAVHRLQKEVDALVEQWKEYKRTMGAQIEWEI